MFDRTGSMSRLVWARISNLGLEDDRLPFGKKTESGDCHEKVILCRFKSNWKFCDHAETLFSRKTLHLKNFMVGNPTTPVFLTELFTNS